MLRNLIGVVSLLAVLGMVVPAHDASAQEGTWPEKGKTITWLIPYAPAGGFDLHSRAVSVGLKKALGVNVILRNRPGAGGSIAWNLLWTAKPDGYTIGTVNIPGAIVSEIFASPKPVYELKGFSWLGRISSGPYVWAAGAKTQFRTLKDFHDAKEVLITSTGVGATGWVTSLLTHKVMGFNARFILGYPGAPAANMGIVRGEGHARALGLDSPGQMRFVEDGDMRAVWVYLDKRDPRYPDVPTVGELGFPQLRVLASHRVVTAPPGMPKDRQAILQKAFETALKDPEVLERFKKMKAKIAPVVGDDWNTMLDGFYGLINEYSDVFAEALQKK